MTNRDWRDGAEQNETNGQPSAERSGGGQGLDVLFDVVDDVASRQDAPSEGAPPQDAVRPPAVQPAAGRHTERRASTGRAEDREAPGYRVRHSVILSPSERDGASRAGRHRATPDEGAWAEPSENGTPARRPASGREQGTSDVSADPSPEGPASPSPNGEAPSESVTPPRRLNWLVDYMDEPEDAAGAPHANGADSAPVPQARQGRAGQGEEHVQPASERPSGRDEECQPPAPKPPAATPSPVHDRDGGEGVPVLADWMGRGASMFQEGVAGDGGTSALPATPTTPEAADEERSTIDNFQAILEDAEAEARAASEESATSEADDEVGTPESQAVPEPESAAAEVTLADASGDVLDVAELVELAGRDRVVAQLLREGTVRPEYVRQARRRKERRDLSESLWRLVAQADGVDADAVYAAAAQVYAFPVADLKANPPSTEFIRSVVETFSEERRDQLLDLGVVPVRAVRSQQRDGITLQFVTYDPARSTVHQLLRKMGIDSYDLLYARQSVVNGLLADAFPRKNEYLERIDDESAALDFGANYQEEETLIDEDQLEAEISRSKLINLFEATLVEAVRQGASDIHIYPNADKEVEIHFRTDGRLHQWHTESKVHPEAFLAVVKDNSTNVDRFERDAAQDGFIQRWVDRALIRFRVSVMPIANASQEVRSESIVIRVLDDRKVITDLSKLGLLKGALERFDHAIRQPHGMVILTGPTGSGKSTTLVASLHQVVTPEVNVLTVEDPVEYIIPGVRQIKLNHKLSLEGALRSILRHDPDVVMVGEMRDRATAELAIKLANTGHLTFSTLHTNDAPSAISRLYKMGIEPFLIAYAINLVVAQRLIRRLCPDCKRVDHDPDTVLLDKLGFTVEEMRSIEFHEAGRDKQCPTCGGTGYKGRRAISEALYFSRDVRHMIVEADGMIDEDKVRELARSEGMLTLLDSAREVVRMGDTSVQEMLRVVASDGH